MRKLKCFVCKELVGTDDLYVVKYESLKGRLIQKHGHKDCVTKWYDDYLYTKNTFTCNICKKKLHIDNKFTFEYENANSGRSVKEGHENCIKDWYDEYSKETEVFQLIAEILDIPALTGTIVSKIRNLHKSYRYEYIIKAIETKRTDIVKNVNYGFHYIFAIISNNVPLVYREEQKKIEQINREPNNEGIMVVDMSKSKKIDTTDYSTLLD